MLSTGKVLFWAYSDDARLWDPATGAITLAQLAGYNFFCSGHATLPDGRLLVTGGHIANEVGLPRASVFDPFTNMWTPVPDMNAARWYPSNVTLGNGDILTIAGNVDTIVGENTLPQVWDHVGNSWRDLVNARLLVGSYPFVHLAPDGRVFLSGALSRSMFLDTSGNGSWTDVALNTLRDSGSSVMYDQGKVMVLGGGDPPKASADVIDLNAATPAWRAVPSMSFARRQLNATILADGTVLATGGSSGPGFNNEAFPVFTSEIWNPATETWRLAASAARPRLYHSSALLLPDGRVFSAGGQGEENMEVYSPPYLFNGTRPTITSAPDTISHGQQFFVATPNATSITKVHLIRLSSVTHAFNQDQRINRLQFSQGPGGLNLTAPANGNIGPPGHYMLFIVNGTGVPSVAKIVRLGPAGAAPAAPANLAASATTSQVSLTWSTVNGATGYKVFRSTTSGSYNFGSPLATVPSPSYIDSAVTNGTTYYYTVRATNGGGDSPSSNEASATPSTSLLPGSATFVRTDTTTQGNWISNYGRDGYLVANEIPSVPPYAQVSVIGAATHTWDFPSDVRALQRPGGTGRIASQFYSTSFFTYDVRLTDGQPHRIALYLLDWDSGGGREQTVDVVDASTNTRLDSQIVANFTGGVYLVWEVRGHVEIRVLRDTYSPNPTVSGVFFDPVSDLPSVTLTAPANGATYVAPATIVMNATASTPTGSITKVEFFQGATALGEDLTAPYSVTWSNAPAGPYVLTAKATTSGGATGTSAPISITVTGNAAPAVTLTAPANNATFTAPATVPITATASDSDGTITLVEFFQGTTKIGDDNAAPYSFSWPNVIAGSYSLTAKATDSAGGTTTSAAIAITVNPAGNVPPTVSITAPANGATFTAPATVPITATASDSDGTITLVEFFQGTTKIGDDNTAPYSFSWPNVIAGSYSLTAKATDSAGGATTSAAIAIGVGGSAGGSATFVGADTTTQGNWIATYGSNGYLIANEIPSVPPYAQVSVIGAATHVWDFPSHVSALQRPGGTGRIASQFSSTSFFTYDVRLTDGQPHRIALYFLDWDSGGARAQTVDVVDASTNTPLDSQHVAKFTGGVYLVWEVSGHVHIRVTKDPNVGVNATASGVFFDPVSDLPAVTLTAPANGATYVAPATIVMNATASTPTGSITKVEFFRDATWLGEDLTAPYSVTWSNAPAGPYGLTAKATTSGGATGTSAPISITVTGNAAPAVTLTAPANNATFTAPATVPITATASDSDGTITLVEFFQGTTKIGDDNAAPYSFSWPNVIAGSYSLTAKATDSAGGTTTSAAIAITVNPAGNVPPTVSITAPANGATFTAPATVPITATASDSDGTITLVEFFQGTTKIGDDNTAPYSFSWPNVIAGSYSLTAKATDSAGGATTSAAIAIGVGGSAGGSATFVGADTTTQGNWIATYGSNGYLIANEIPSVPPYAQVSVIGAATHVWDFPSHVSALQRPGGTGRIASQFSSTSFFTYDVRLTDGQPHRIALYFLDWDSGGARAQTVDVVDASTNTPLDSQHVAKFTGGVYLVWEVSGHVHIRVTKDPNVGVNATASGVFFDPVSDLPAVSLTAPANGATYVAPATIVMNATASTPTGSITKVEFFRDATWLGEDLTAPYSVTWSNAPAGPYGLTAKATTSGGATGTSAPISITVTGNAAPAVTLTAPANNATFTAPATVPITATASDSDGTITLVEFFQGTTKIGDDNTAPYSFSWPNVIAGSYSLTAKATDSAGGATTSAAIAIVVGGSAGGSATFVRADTTTQGNWIATYGSNGYLIANEIPSLPPYAQVSVIGAATHVWDFPSHVSALQRPGGTGRIASQFYSGTNFTYDVQLTDGQPHRIALYFLDWDSGGARAQTVDVVDASTNTPLDSQHVAKFTGGVYLVWEVSGHVHIRVTKDPNVGVNATASGVFFDPVSDPPAVTLTAPVNWSDNSSNESGFRIERSLNGTTFTEIDTRGVNAEQYTGSNLTPNTHYYYRVRAYNGAENSAYSNVISVRTPQ